MSSNPPTVVSTWLIPALTIWSAFPCSCLTFGWFFVAFWFLIHNSRSKVTEERSESFPLYSLYADTHHLPLYVWAARQLGIPAGILTITRHLTSPSVPVISAG